MSWPPETERLWPPDGDPEHDFKLPKGARHVRTRKDPDLGTVVTYEMKPSHALCDCVVMLAIIVVGLALALCHCGGAPFTTLEEISPDAGGEAGGATSDVPSVEGGVQDAPFDVLTQDTWAPPPELDSGQPPPELDAGAVETSPPETTPEPEPEAGPVCTPLTRGGIECNSLAYPTPSYYCRDGYGVVTPPECTCAETYNCACLQAHVPCDRFYCVPSADGISVECP